MRWFFCCAFQNDCEVIRNELKLRMVLFFPCVQGIFYLIAFFPPQHLTKFRYHTCHTVLSTGKLFCLESHCEVSIDTLTGISGVLDRYYCNG